MAKTSVVPATQALVDGLKGHLRKADIDEVFAASGENADSALQQGFKLSEYCYVGLIDDKPVACFGARRTSLISNTGVVWMLGTDDIKRFPKAFIKEAGVYIKLMADNFSCLHNWVDARNTISIKWLRWEGFTMAEKPEPFGVFNLPFFKFWIKGA